jgi:hypothetical protein
MELTERILALALFTGSDIDEIEEERGSNNSFVINPHQVKEGEPPEHYIRHAADLHTFLAEHGKDVKTWQELIVITPERIDTRVQNVGRANYQALQNSLFGNGSYQRDFNGESWPQKDGEIHWYANGFYHLISTEDKDANQWHVYALRAAFNGEPIEDRREYGYRDSGQYRVLTDDEADEAASESVRSYVEDCVLEEIPEQYRMWFDTDGFVKHCVKEDGRAHSIATYDSEENSVDIDASWDQIVKLLAERYELPEDEVDPIVDRCMEEFGVGPQDLSGEYYIYRTN